MFPRELTGSRTAWGRFMSRFGQGAAAEANVTRIRVEIDRPSPGE